MSLYFECQVISVQADIMRYSTWCKMNHGDIPTGVESPFGTGEFLFGIYVIIIMALVIQTTQSTQLEHQSSPKLIK